MKNAKWLAGIIILLLLPGCVPLIVGAGVGALGGYAASSDTVQAQTDTPYDMLWESSRSALQESGSVKKEDFQTGTIEGLSNKSRVWIRLIRLTQATTTIKVSSRRFHMPDLKTAQVLFVKIMEGKK